VSLDNGVRARLEDHTRRLDRHDSRLDRVEEEARIVGVLQAELVAGRNEVTALRIELREDLKELHDEVVNLKRIALGLLLTVLGSAVTLLLASGQL
jgi:hypothetical protein